ncbi:helix-turn-helix domain-containing protein [Kibdelosporangium aridum]|uniref:helix-turn-helix domain-containing protein n=1 Tax=Kibdelosporangium aridum TaxID=2030 RepID=UPI00052679D6
MPQPSTPPFYRRQFGVKLRRLREKAALTLDDAAARLDMTRSALHRVETGLTRVNVHLTQSMMDLYDTDDQELLDEAREAMKQPWYRPFGLANTWHIDVETKAIQVKDFSPRAIPELLQTEQYASALFTSQRSPAPENQVAVLKVRQQRLVDATDPLQLIAVVDELTLRRMVGGPAIMRSQLLSLVTSAKLTTVTLRVLPYGSDITASTMGAFTLGMMSDTAVPTLLHIEHVAGSQYVDDTEQLQSAMHTFEQLCAQTLSPADSINLIETIATGLIRHG